MCALSEPAPTLDVLITINQLMTVGQVVPGIAHELNNSFQVISGLVEMLSVRGDLPPDVVTRLQRIGAHADRAAATVRDLQAFARHEPADPGQIDLRGISERALALRRYQLSRARVDATVEPGGDGIVANIHPRQLQLIVLNLIINAEQALAGRDDGVVRVSVGRDGGHAWVAVTDNGPGVRADLREKIFEPFFTTRERDAAAGVGLATARGLARRHGGDVRLAPSQQGAKFVVELPV
jgi:signal transduction histidine kinase